MAVFSMGLAYALFRVTTNMLMQSEFPGVQASSVLAIKLKKIFNWKIMGYLKKRLLHDIVVYVILWLEPQTLMVRRQSLITYHTVSFFAWAIDLHFDCDSFRCCLFI